MKTTPEKDPIKKASDKLAENIAKKDYSMDAFLKLNRAVTEKMYPELKIKRQIINN